MKHWPRALTKQKESRHDMGLQCRNRTRLYHTLLHYKFRLLLKIRTVLEKNGKSVTAMVADMGFVSAEVDRFQKLLKSAQGSYGGSGEDVWADSERRGSSSSRSTPGSSNRGGGGRRESSSIGASSSSGLMLRWLNRQGDNCPNDDDEIEEYHD